jgi:hypothetical protein
VCGNIVPDGLSLYAVSDKHVSDKRVTATKRASWPLRLYAVSDLLATNTRILSSTDLSSATCTSIVSCLQLGAGTCNGKTCNPALNIHLHHSLLLLKPETLNPTMNPKP